MIRFVIASAVFFASSLAFSASFADLAGTHTFKGPWKSRDGSKGLWHSVVETSRNEAGGTHVKFTTVVHHEGGKFTMNSELDLSSAGAGFFDVMVDGAKAGSGYCFKNLCHYGVHTAEKMYEETYTFTPKGISVIGSVYGEHRVAWLGYSRHN